MPCLYHHIPQIKKEKESIAYDSNSGALTSSVYIYNIITHGIHNLVEEKRGQIGIERKKKRKSSKKNFNCWLFTLFVLQYQAPIEGGLIGGFLRSNKFGMSAHEDQVGGRFSWENILQKNVGSTAPCLHCCVDALYSLSPVSWRTWEQVESKYGVDFIFDSGEAYLSSKTKCLSIVYPVNKTIRKFLKNLCILLNIR